MKVKDRLALAKAKALAAKRKAQALNEQADPHIDAWLTRVTKRLTDSPYTGPIILVTVLVAGVVGLVVML